jgi:superfamily I DNA and RNA helicase
LEKLVGYKDLVQCRVFPERSSELAWVADQTSANIQKDELAPEEILVISLDYNNSRTDLWKLKQILSERKIEAIRPGYDTPSDVFQQKGSVTLTNIFPAKGNEASIVYIVGFEQVGTNPRLIVQERNQAFTAMTRTRGWCMLTGIGRTAEILFKEVEKVLEDPEKITFTVPDPKTIQRNLDSLEYERRRNRIKKANDLANELRRLLAEIDDPEERKKIMERLKMAS